MTVYVLRVGYYEKLIGVYASEADAYAAMGQFDPDERDFSVTPVEVGSPASFV